MRYLSLFSGIEAASVAWKPLGWEPVAFAEIERAPCEVLAHHYPGIPNLGDVTTITDDVIASLGPIDLVIGGSPCTDTSLAGRRKGMAEGSGTRSALFHQQLRIFHAARRLCGARFLLWENVLGSFSSNKRADFAAVVGKMAGCEPAVPRKWETEGLALGENGLLEWCVLDAQWFGLAQRRKRVFALLDTGDWQDRPPVLLEPQGVSGHTPPGRGKGKVAPTVPARSTGGGGLGTDFDCDGGLIPDVAGTMKSCASGGGQSNSADHAAAGYMIPMLMRMREGKEGGGKGPLLSEDQSLTLATANDQVLCFHENQRAEVTMSDTSGALKNGGGKPGQGYSAALIGMQVRRFTPIETSRLQGFADTYCHVPTKRRRVITEDDALYLKQHGIPVELTGKGWVTNAMADGPIYKMHGNSMATYVIRWIGESLERRAATTA